jgi:hypothetical protein
MWNRSLRIHVVMRWLIVRGACRSRYVVLDVVGAKEVEAAQRIHFVATECQGRMQSRKRRREEGRRRRSLVLQRELLHCADAMSYMDWDVCHGACRFVLRRDAKRGAEDELADLKRNSGR